MCEYDEYYKKLNRQFLTVTNHLVLEFFAGYNNIVKMINDLKITDEPTMKIKRKLKDLFSKNGIVED